MNYSPQGDDGDTNSPSGCIFQKIYVYIIKNYSNILKITIRIGLQIDLKYNLLLHVG